MEVGFFKDWNENYSAVLITVVLFFLLFLTKIQEDSSKHAKDIIQPTQIEIASSSK